jgi:hypothetical protein
MNMCILTQLEYAEFNDTPVSSTSHGCVLDFCYRQLYLIKNQEI